MPRRHTGLAGALLLLFVFVLVGCGQVGTSTNGDGGSTTAISPSITKQPANQSVSVGTTANFTVIASGSAPLSYQWRKNDGDIDGATQEVYSAPASTEDNGATFSVLVSNPVGTVESQAAMLTVMPADVAPTITSQPADQSITAGQTATLSVVAAGTDPLTYQWQKNGAVIAGATSASYTTPAENTTDDGALFAVIVSNTAGSVASRAARLGVASSGSGVAPSISAQPPNVSVKVGATATFAVTATGTAPLSFQWTKNGASISGANSTSYTTPPAAATDGGAVFTVVINNTAGSITSRGALLTVTGAIPTIISQPADQSVVSGASATFSVVAGGSAPLSYQWQRNGAAISGANAISYTSPAVSTADNGDTFSVVVSNSAGTVTSRAAKLTVTGTALSITTQPADQTVTAGNTATFSVVAAGSAPLTYQWQRNAAAIAGATGSSYTTPATTTSDSGATFAVVITNSTGSITSRAAKLTVNGAAPTITTQPADQTVTAGNSATFNVSAAGSAPLAYQWHKNGAAIAGATGSSYTTPAETTGDSGVTFSVVVTNSVGSITSRAAKLTVNGAAPTITTQPADQSVTSGNAATFNVAATGSAPLSYQWRKNGSAIAGATAASYTTPPTTSADNGATFVVVVTNSAGSATSRTATLAVTAGATAPTITTQPADQTIQKGQTATFSVTASGTAPLSYQWRKNGTVISGAVASSYTTPAETTADSGATFSVTVTNTTGIATSRNALLTVTTVSAGGGTDVVTYKYDRARTGQNLTEKILTPGNVTSSTFGKLRFLSADGKVDAQPLYLSGLIIGGASHNVVFVATENDSMYAFDADSGAQLWKKSLIPAGETVSDDDNCLNVAPTIGITATPVIDRNAGANGTIFVVAMTQSGTTYHHRLHALDLATGAELLGGPTPIAASFPKSGGTLNFDSSQGNEHAALLLNNGTIYTTWTSQCDHYFYSGWVIAYSESTLQQTGVLNVGPNSGGGGPAIWMAGDGPAADSANNVYLITANGGFETTLDANGFPNMGDFGNSFLRLSFSGGSLVVADYFSPSNTVALSNTDKDLGSGGIILLPDQTDSTGTTRHLAVGAGKDGNIYLVNRDSMGHFSSTSNNMWQLLPSILGNLGEFPSTGYGGVWSTPAYFNGHVYYSAVADFIKSFSFSSAKLSTAAVAATSVKFGYPGALPVISANGTSNAILWAHQNSNPAVLYAFDPANLTQLYSSSDAAGGRDQFGAGNKFITPVVADGKVFVATTNGVAVFGLLP